MARPLDDYKKKRDFGATPEPEPAEAPEAVERSGPPVFVVHRHAARNLHWDLRLEMQGVLRSWAVPKGFSYAPQEKRLAVRTEDHPLEYEHFDGIIPAGHYGAGSMTIWDRGTYAVVPVEGARTASEAVAKGELKVVLFGRRLRGEWHVVKTTGGPNHWLLFKSQDRYAGPHTDSVLGVDLGAASASAWPLEVLRRDTDEVLEEPLLPLVPESVCEPFTDPDWLFEAELPGRRMFAAKRADQIALVEDGAALAIDLPELQGALARLRATDAVLDGVLVATDETGRPSREALERALAPGVPPGVPPADSRGDSRGIAFYALDLVHWDGLDLRALGTLERTRALRAILPASPALLCGEHVAGEGEALAGVAAAGGFAALLAKRAAAAYAPGNDAWRRIPLANAPRATRRSRVRFTNLDKILWPAELGHPDGRPITKGEFCAFYEDVADVLLPHLRDRPVHMNRFPDGITGKSFYQREAKEHTPAWIRTVPIASDSKSAEVPHLVCDERDTLLWMANSASIDLHPWLSRVSALDSPDWTVLDLDPKDAPFTHVVRIARAAGKLLTGIGLRPLLKTSGASGLHVFVPLAPGYSYDQSRMFCEAVARSLVRELKDVATVERSIASRDGKVYLDFGQNRRSQTIVPPYCVRPVPGASVSTPLSWDELDSSLSPRQFTFDVVRERLARHGDMFRAALTDRQDLLPAIEGLNAHLHG